MESWQTVAAAHPRRHAKYYVRRHSRNGTTLHTATPCYGMHEPWWVEKLLDGTEAPPVAMQAGDEWQPIASECVEAENS